MRLLDLFDQLTAGELSQLSMGGSDTVGIQECDYSKIIPHINLGLTELHKRFPLKVREVMVQQYDHIQKYTIHTDYAETNTDPENTNIRYVVDSVYEPFLNDILKIETIYNEDGQELYSNDNTEYWSVHVIGHNVVQVPYPDSANALSIVYRANHPRIDLSGLTPSEIEVDIPHTLLEPLLLYVASRVYSNLNSDGQVIEGNTYSAKFEASCKMIEELNLISKDNRSNTKPEMNLWP